MTCVIGAKRLYTAILAYQTAQGPQSGSSVLSIACRKPHLRVSQAGGSWFLRARESDTLSSFISARRILMFSVSSLKGAHLVLESSLPSILVYIVPSGRAEGHNSLPRCVQEENFSEFGTAAVGSVVLSAAFTRETSRRRLAEKDWAVTSLPVRNVY